MPKAYSDDLRVRILDAYEAKAGSMAVLARQFRVSAPYVEKIRKQLRETGSKLRPVQPRRGPVSRVGTGERERLRSWLREQADLTGAELQQRLGAEGVRICQSRVSQILGELGLRRKKNAARPRARE